MEMSKQEIVSSYKSAADRNKQIEILADLNVCSKREILDVLSEAGAISGLPVKKKKPQGPQKMKWTAELNRELLRLKDEGLSDSEVGERLGCSAASVAGQLYRIRRQQKEFNSYAPSVEQTIVETLAENDEQETDKTLSPEVPVDEVDREYITELEQMCEEYKDALQRARQAGDMALDDLHQAVEENQRLKDLIVKLLLRYEEE